jgi:hypothetical protein
MMMSNGAYAGIRLAARAGKPKPDMEDTMPDEDEDMEEDTDMKKPKGKKKETEYMNEEQAQAAISASRSEGFAEANARAGAVISSNHYEGREKLAAAMLANDKLSADEIVTMLAASPAASSAASSEDTDRASMRAALADSQPKSTGQADEPKAAGAADAVDWASAHAEVAKDRGLSVN